MKTFLALALTVLVVPAFAADGDLELTFGIGGRITTDFSGSFDAATALAIQSDGKIVAAGFASSEGSIQSRDFGLSRYNRDGSLDATFGIGGKVTTDFSGGLDSAYALATSRQELLAVPGWSQASGLTKATAITLVSSSPFPQPSPSACSSCQRSAWACARRCL